MTLYNTKANKRLKIASVACLIIGCIILILVCAAAIIISLDARHCTEPVEAVVADQYVSNSVRSRGEDKTLYAPIFTYDYSNETYTSKYSFSAGSPAYTVGESVKLMIDPEEPTRFYIPGDRQPIKQAIPILCGGLLFTAIGLLGLGAHKRRALAPNATEIKK
ncbi:MAG: DUF3592 domain-containing protein [Ruminococcus sp.]|nr:DUF3592 domain-containing protein [Ruminococcus sp.]